MLIAALLLAAITPARQFATESVDRLLESADPESGMSRFVGYPAQAAKDIFVPNTNFWARTIDFSCASPWNSASGTQRAGTLISKRHVVFAKHFPVGKGARILFVDNEGGVCPCHVDALRPINDCDIMIGLLNAEVTPNIHPAKVLPPDFYKTFGYDGRVPVVTFNQRERVGVVEMAMSTNAVDTSGITLDASTDLRKRFTQTLVGGDSGNPVFMIFGNEPVLLFCVKAGGVGYGPWLFKYHNEIQAAMDALCPGYKLEAIDLAAISAMADKNDAK